MRVTIGESAGYRWCCLNREFGAIGLAKDIRIVEVAICDGRDVW
jgi:hypothetical protein